MSFLSRSITSIYYAFTSNQTHNTPITTFLIPFLSYSFEFSSTRLQHSTKRHNTYWAPLNERSSFLSLSNHRRTISSLHNNTRTWNSTLGSRQHLRSWARCRDWGPAGPRRRPAAALPRAARLGRSSRRRTTSWPSYKCTRCPCYTLLHQLHTYACMRQRTRPRRNKPRRVVAPALIYTLRSSERMPLAPRPLLHDAGIVRPFFFLSLDWRGDEREFFPYICTFVTVIRAFLL